MADVLRTLLEVLLPPLKMQENLLTMEITNQFLGIIGEQAIYIIPFWGRIYNLINYNLSNEDYLIIKFEDFNEYHIDFYDKNYFVEKSEKFKDFHTMALKSGRRYAGLLDITLHDLLPEVSKCNDDDDYSFLVCTRVCITKRTVN